MIDVTKLAVLLGRLVARLLGWVRPRRAVATGGTDRNILGHDRHGDPVEWPRPDIAVAGSVLCLAASGAGKTEMLAGAISRELAGDSEGNDIAKRIAHTVVCTKGDIVHRVHAAILASCPARAGDVVLLEPFGGRAVPPLNLCKLEGDHDPAVLAVQLADLLAKTSASVGDARVAGLGARQIDVLAQLFEAALACEHEDRSLLWALDALNDKGGLALLGKLTSSKRSKRFLLSGTAISDELTASCASRIRSAFALTPTIEAMISAPTCVPIVSNGVLGPGKVLLVDIAGAPTTTLRDVFANLLLRLVFDQALSRPSPWKGWPLRVTVDEAHTVAPTLADVAELVATTGRSKGISATYSLQSAVLLESHSRTLLEVLVGNARASIIGRVSAEDAKRFARTRAPQPGVEESFNAIQAAFAAGAANARNREFFYLTPGTQRRFRSADIPVRDWDEAAQRFASEIQQARQRYTVSPYFARVTLQETASREALSIQTPFRPTACQKPTAPTLSPPASSSSPSPQRPELLGEDDDETNLTRWG